MNGLRLADMDAADMLDVIHYFFDQDINYASGEQAEAHSQVRSAMYKDLYNIEYKYGVSSKNSNKYSSTTYVADFDLEEEELKPVDPVKKAREVKPYVAPTTVDVDGKRPFGSMLDAPLA